MIISRTPFRISFAGGGSDIPAFYRQSIGAVVSSSIDKYMYITAHPHFDPSTILLKYSETEEVKKALDLKNTIARSIMSERNINGIEVTSIGDMPAKTGLGSSSSFAVGLHHCLNEYQKIKSNSEHLAQAACDTELNKLFEPIGKQDQYAAAYGGLNYIEFHPDETVSVIPINLTYKTRETLNNNLMLFYTGHTRPAGSILKAQQKNITDSSTVFTNTKRMVGLAKLMKVALEGQNLDDFGSLLNEGWQLKRTLAKEISTSHIDHWYAAALKNGALGGKLLGAGGGGFMLFYCKQEEQDKLIKALPELRHIPISLSMKGSEIIFNNQHE